MKINGQPASDELSLILSELMQLPRGIEQVPTIYEALITNKLTADHSARMSEVLQEAIATDRFGQAIELEPGIIVVGLPEVHPSPQQQAILLFERLALLCRASQNGSLATDIRSVCVDQLIWLSKKLEHFQFLEHAYIIKTNLISELASYKQKINDIEPTNRIDEIEKHLALGAIADREHQFLKKSDPKIDTSALIKTRVHHYAHAYKLSEGRSIDVEASIVLQHEVGFSTKKKLGTYYLHQCVAVVIRDPISRMTALAHVDNATTGASLAKVIDKFPAGSMLEVSLAGARIKSINNKEATRTCRSNVHKILIELHQYENVNIVAADILEKASPTAIVVDPENGKIFQAMPDQREETLGIRERLMFLNRPQAATPLHVAFEEPDGIRHVNYPAGDLVTVFQDVINDCEDIHRKAPGNSSLMSYSMTKELIAFSAIAYIRAQITPEMMEILFKTHIHTNLETRVINSQPKNSFYLTPYAHALAKARKAQVPEDVVAQVIGRYVLADKAMLKAKEEIPFETAKQFLGLTLKSVLSDILQNVYLSALETLVNLTTSKDQPIHDLSI